MSVALSDERIIDIWCNTPTTRFGGEVEDQEIIDFARDEASVSEGWTSVEERLPKFPSTVLVAYESDADGEPCLDTGEAILHADGKWYGLGVFYALGREPRYEPRLTEKKVVCWKPMPSYSAPHATETVEMTDNSGWYEMAEWAVERWNAEVKNRPLINVHRRSLDDVWRQVIRHCGGDPDVLIGPNHDALLAASSAATVSDAASVQGERDVSNADIAAAATQHCYARTAVDGWIFGNVRELRDFIRAASSATAPLTSDSQAARDVLAERQRQMSVEGWTPEHDDEHDGNELSRAAACYALEGIAPYTGYGIDVKRTWSDTGWSWAWWKPKDRRRNLVKAGALILAEIERLDRAQSTNGEQS